MPEFDNMKAMPIVVDGEVVAINFANRFDEDTAMRIVKEDDLCCAEKFTDKKYVNYLSIEDIKEIWGQKFFEKNECLVAYRNY